MSEGAQIKRMKIVFRGIVQGVGFRPTVYRCALACGLAGFVQNRRSEVVAEIEGLDPDLLRFHKMLEKSLPAPARIDFRSVVEIEPAGEREFRIVDSENSSYVLPPIAPDLALCDSCKRELLDPDNRRYLYPFITCTECGPRYSIVEDTPFDRERTSMADFAQCERCRAEYESPADRRFHSQTNSCPDCGPALRLVTSGGEEQPGDPIVEAVRALSRGEVLALQGIGGFHLALDPRFPDAVARLRREKERGAKPFALMVRDLEEAEALCLMPPAARSLLESSASPIVILPAREPRPRHLESVSELDTLGIMLPYTPLHYLLFFHPEIDIPYRHLIMTSGNRGDEPIIAESAEARVKLADTADLFLFHNRRILLACDDSVLRFTHAEAGEEKVESTRSAEDGEPREPPAAPKTMPHFFVRRSRGYVPEALKLPRPIAAPTLAAGGDLKSAPALAVGDRLFLAPHIGDLDKIANRDAYIRAVEKMLSLYEASPERAVYDLHPGYFSSNWARTGSISRKIAVQHHHAHLLSVMAEHGLDEALGVAFDGTGYGGDGTIWGGEFLYATRGGFERLGSFRPFALPGGDQATLHPARIAFSLMHGYDARAEELVARGLSKREAVLIPQMIEGSVNSPISSSAGRLFDAAAALLCANLHVSYEGEGPMRLEALATRAQRAGAAWRGRGRPTGSGIVDWEKLLPCTTHPRSAAVIADISNAANSAAMSVATASVAATTSAARVSAAMASSDSRDMFLFDPRPLLSHVARRKDTEEISDLALLFHEAMTEAIVRGAVLMRAKTGLDRLCLSGGVFQNALLRRLLIPRLEREGFEAFWNLRVPPGDGGLALGQAWYDESGP
jgi:hydrogenase maturation protein HypF